ncbi:hypothetical protein, partial [Escherichia coli]|uniref:hypothetical protein n=1 Tax=Escherichia coli TaxID=562 RepID=UPI001BC842E7
QPEFTDKTLSRKPGAVQFPFSVFLWNRRNPVPCDIDVMMFFILLTVPPGKVPEHILPPAQTDGRG